MDAFMPNVDQVEVEKIRLTVQRVIDRELLNAGYIPVHVLVEQDAHRLAVELRKFIGAVGAEHIDIEESWPEDWWQAVRARWLPAWWLRRRPVRMRSVSVHRKVYAAVCPHIDLPARDNGSDHFRFLYHHSPVSRP